MACLWMILQAFIDFSLFTFMNFSDIHSLKAEYGFNLSWNF